MSSKCEHAAWFSSHLMNTSAILNPIPEPPPVIKATWSLWKIKCENREGDSLSGTADQ